MSVAQERGRFGQELDRVSGGKFGQLSGMGMLVDLA